MIIPSGESPAIGGADRALAADVLDGVRVGFFPTRQVGLEAELALTFESSPNLWLRFQALHAITAASDAGYAHCVELQLGVVTRRGRRDRAW